MRQERDIKAFGAQIWAFYEHSGRHDLPWRKTKDPYKILVSEVMLQQTQIARVLEKYPQFLKVFPNVRSLADVPLSRVLSVWQGMGYNRRARFLRDTAQKIMREHNGRVPKTEEGLRALPGIGHYTANAILTFAHNEPRVFIETNIRRVFIHHFFKDKQNVSDREVLPLVEATVDPKNPREWYYALMDYGAHLPKIARKNPNTQSKHYVRQSAFKGSVRELRGKIVRALNDGSKTFMQLKKICENDMRTKEATSALKKDGLIVYEKRKYKLA
jgi:A/G-specific adenine glycosylase